MRNLHHSSRRSMLPALLVLLVAAGFTAVPLAGQERESPPSRPLPVTERPPSPPPSPPPAPPAPPPSNPGGNDPPSTSPGGGGGGHHGYHPRHPHRYRYGYWGFGHFWPYSRFYWHYDRPFYPWGMVWYPAYSSDTRLGALDLGIKPRKTEVYVDGQFVGYSGQFDGHPGYLWLSEGRHQLVFYRDGWETATRTVSIRSGPVRALRLDLAKGTSTPPEELFDLPPRRARASDPSAERRPQERTARRNESAEPTSELDLRIEPGRLKLEVAPVDASVYLDGRFLGSAAELSNLHSGMMVDAGEHFLDVQRPGYETERVHFSVEAGDEAEVKVALSSDEGPGD